MTFDATQAHALRTAINETIARLAPPPIGGGIPGEARQALLNHLDHLLAQERLLFTHVVVLPETKTPPVADTPWYPDESGEWVEVPDDLMEMSPRLNAHDFVETLLRSEREERIYTERANRADIWRWNIAPTECHRIVAYKVVKP